MLKKTELNWLGHSLRRDWLLEDAFEDMDEEKISKKKKTYAIP